MTKVIRIFPLSLPMLLVFLFILPAKSQTTRESNEDFVEIPLDMRDNEIRLLLERRTSPSFKQLTERSLSQNATAQDRRFLVGLNFAALPKSVIERGRARSNAKSQQAFSASNEETLLSRTSYLNYGFTTSYPEFNATLSCYWRYDRRLNDLAERADEADLERRARQRLLNLPPLSREARPVDERAADRNQVTRLMEHGFVSTERQFKKAGRPCMITVRCRASEVDMCDGAIVDELVKSATIVRPGELPR